MKLELLEEINKGQQKLIDHPTQKSEHTFSGSEFL